MEAGEMLMARDGIETVSMRAVAIAAGQSNVAAVQYHFGTKDALLIEIFEWRVWLMEPRRKAMLDALDDLAACPVRSLLSLIYLPYLDMCDAEGRHVYARLLLEYLTVYRRNRGPHPAEDETRGELVIVRVLREFFRRIEPMPASSARLFLTQMTSGFLGALCEYDNMRDKALAPEPVESLTERMLDFMAAGVDAVVAALETPGS